MPNIAASIDALGSWLPQLDRYLREIVSVEATIDYTEVAYGSAFEAAIPSIVMIPGSGQFVYDTVEVVYKILTGDDLEEYIYRTANRNAHETKADAVMSLDQLVERFPQIKNISVVVSWFGTDLRAGECSLKPGSDNYEFEIIVDGDPKTVPENETTPYAWQVAGRTNATAYKISREPDVYFGSTTVIGRKNYGGTPSDESVKRYIEEMTRRGLKCTFYPFILMDIADGNTLPNPYGGTGQPVFPWRGRITCHPAPGQPGTVDKKAAAKTQIDAFAAQYREMILHYANLCAAAGGVDAFILGTELRGLTWVRDDTGGHPFVDALVSLAAEVRKILGPQTKITYAADWSEFVPYQVPEGGIDFHLDKLWASPAIDAMSIDNYWPLSDWRGVDGIDEAKYPNIYDPTYLAENVQGGEGYDWYYADEAARIAQVRTPITDGLGKPWVFRYKDIRSWWTNQHYNRPGWIESSTPTEWVPQSKPFWFTEIGCPAVDKGSNQPNVFVDPKSSESFYPYFSLGNRDDLIQRRHIAAFFSWYGVDLHNPRSTVYDGRMLDTSRIYIYCWDARPYPQFPELLNIWSDGPNYNLGHWIEGRPLEFPAPDTPITPTEEIELLPAKPMPKGEPAVDPKTGHLRPSMHHYLAQIEQIAKRLRNLQIVALQERDR